MPIIVNLKSYLHQLSAVENKKLPVQRREIPNIGELADLVGMHRNPFSRWINNKTESSNHEMVAKIIAELRRRGFDTQVSNILVYIEEEK